MQVKTKYGLFVGSIEDYQAFEVEMLRREGKTVDKSTEEVKPETEPKTPKKSASKTTVKRTTAKK